MGAFIAAVLLAGIAAAQTVVGGGSLTERPAGGGLPGATHAWYVASDSRGATVVFHLPPRLESLIPEGSIRFANELHEAPAAAAARGDSLFLLYESTSAIVTPKTRQVLAMRAVQSSPGRWDTVPADRLQVCVPFPAGGDLLGLTGSDAGVFGAVNEGGVTTLHVMDGGEWRSIPSPVAMPSGTRLFGVPGGVGVLLREPGGARIGIGEVQRVAGETHLGWEWFELRGEAAALAAHPGAAAVCCERHLVLGGPGDEGAYTLMAATLPLSRGTVWREIAKFAGVPRDASLVTLDSDARVAVFWLKPTSGRTGVLASPQIRELSVATGRVLYEGEARITSPISRSDFLMLAISMTWVIGSIGIGVWSPREKAVVLPPETSIAEAPRRGMASLIDLSIAMTVTAMVRAAPASEALSVTWWLTPAGLIALIWALGGLIVGGTLLEAAAGRTVGKMLTGCRVVSVVPPEGRESHRAGFGQVLIRNVIKWGLPPVGVMALFDPSGRPRADQIARTAVVINAPPEESEDPD